MGSVRRVSAVVFALVALVAAGCANDKVTAAPASSAERTDTTVAPDEADESVEAAEPSSATERPWQKVATGPNCQCSDGSDFFFMIHRGTSDRLVFYLEGGGACFSADTCGPATPSYTRNLADTDADEPATDGIFDFDDEDNPFKDDSIVFVPYCTGDLHMGNAVHDYGEGVVIHHNGASNGATALAAAAATFPDVEQVVVAGSSAGSAPTPVYAGVAHDLFPEARITAIADASGAYPGTAAITTAIGSLWGLTSALPRWPETFGQPASAWSLPGLWVQAAKHDPEITFAKYDTAYDETQQDFVRLAGFPDKDLLEMIDENTAESEAGGAKIASWVGPGELHTILGRDELYTTEVEGHSLLEWITDVVDGKDVPDVHCDGTCGKPAG